MVDLGEGRSMVLLLVVLVVVIAIGATVITDVGESVRTSTGATVTNETLNSGAVVINGTTYTLVNQMIDSVTQCSVPNSTIGSANYTVDITAGTVATNFYGTAPPANSTMNNTGWNCSYTYSRFLDIGYNATVKGQEGMSNISGFVPVVGTIIGALLILGIVGYIVFYSKR